MTTQAAGTLPHQQPRRRSIGARLAAWPVSLDQLRLGWLLGDRFLIIAHRGRKTGRLHRVGVMVLRRDPQGGEVCVAAGKRRADWYRNICAAPAVEVRLCGRRYHASQRLLSTDETADILLAGRRANPFSGRIQCLFFGWHWTTDPVAVRELAASLGRVAFRLGLPA